MSIDYDPQLSEHRLWKIPGEIEPNLDLNHPRLFHTENDLKRARKNVRETEWGEKVLNRINEIVNSSPWFELNENQVSELMPKPYAQFIDFHGLGRMGTDQCPIDGSKMDLIGLRDPVRVRCPQGHEFPIDNEEGWETADGSIYTYVAMWNSFVIRNLRETLEPLAYAYAFTGDKKYANQAAFVMDALASIYPTTGTGPLDRPRTMPGKENGRLDRAIYEIARPLVKYANVYDLIVPSGAFDRDSVTNPGFTMKENVATNLLMNGGDACFRFLHREEHPGSYKHPHNGALDLVRGVLAVGMLFDIDSYLKWIENGPLNLEYYVMNTIDRDGNHYETSPTYNEYTKKVLMSIAELLYRLDCEDHPAGINLFEHPRFQRFYIGSSSRNTIADRLPHYGDVQRIRTKLGAESEEVSVEDETSDPYYIAHRESIWDLDIQEFDFSRSDEFYHTLKFLVRAHEPEKEELWIKNLCNLEYQPINKYLENVWPVGHLSMDTADDLINKPSQKNFRRESELLAGKGLAMLRPADGNNRGVVFRYGPTYRHGHLDELALNIYGADRELSYDPGYNMAHYRVGWCHQTVSHLTTVVNETSQDISKSVGGNLQNFGRGEGFSYVEASDAQVYDHENVDVYRRATAYVDVSDNDSYLIDIFRVDGGHTRDYSFHGLGTKWHLDGVQLSAPKEGSLADPDYWWGDMVDNGDSLRTHQDKEFYWNPPPSNGYGFLGNPQKGSAEDTWSANWSLQNKPGGIRFNMLPKTDRQIIVTDGPEKMAESIGESDGTIKYVLARDQGSDPSTFASVIDPYSDHPNVEAIDELTIDRHSNNRFDPVAFEITLSEDKGTDYVLSSLGQDRLTTTEENRTISTDADFAFIRSQGQGVHRLRIESGKYLRVDDIEVRMTTDCYRFEVKEVFPEEESFSIEKTKQIGSWLESEYAIFDADEYSHNSPYEIQSISEVDGSYIIRLTKSPILARGRITEIGQDGTISIGTVLPAANQYLNHTARDQRSEIMNEYYRGKTIRTESGYTTSIETVESGYNLKLRDASGLNAGETFEILDIKVGDILTIPTELDIQQKEEQVRIKATAPVEVQWPEISSKLEDGNSSVRTQQMDSNGYLRLENEGLGRTVISDL